MKKLILILCLAALLLFSSGCSDGGSHGLIDTQGPTVSELLEKAASGEDDVSSPSSSSATESEGSDSGREYDIDLTQMNSTMVYSKVFDMVSNPNSYVGKTVRMKGAFAVYGGEGRNYYACIIADATACCAEGIEFVLKGDPAYPDGYPIPGSDITVSGTFDIYYENGYPFCQLIEAEFES